MQPNWIPVHDSTRIVAMAYDADSERILVRFPDGVEWQYELCPPDVWTAFSAPGQSKGGYIADVLDHKPNRRFDGD